MNSPEDGKLRLDPELVMSLNTLTLGAKRRIRGTQQGKRRSKQLGASLEFADYRVYTPGDDTRQFDWNVYARTGKPFIKQFLDEQELQVNLMIDVSKSMEFGQKLTYAKQLAACIGYVALNGYDRVSVRMLGEKVERVLPLLRGKGSWPRLLEVLESTPVSAKGHLAAALKESGAVPRQSGMTWLFSDFLLESGVEESLGALHAAGQEVMVIQVLSREELFPRLSGDVRLIDSESGSGKEVAVTPRVIKAYKETLEQYTAGLRRYCFERGMGYALAVADVPLMETIHRTFRESGMLL